MTDDVISAPYASAAPLYRQAGWPAPVPVVGKSLPVSGYTGGDGKWPDEAKISEWITEKGDHNIGLRLPDNVIGIDVDAYDGRRGEQTLNEWSAELGELPPTWHSTSREDGTSGIYFFRIPEGGSWRSDLGRGSNVEIIRTFHRYAVVWPSLHPDTSRRYRWYSPTNEPAAEPPDIETLSALPDAWVRALSKGGSAPSPSGDSISREATRSSRDGQDHSGEDVSAFSREGEPIDIDALFTDGVPPGDQDNMLFSYLCSLRERGVHRAEMIVLGAQLLRSSENEAGKAPWTEQDLIDKVDRVRRDFRPRSAASAELSPALREWAERVHAGQVDVNESPPREEMATDLGNTLRFTRLFRDRVRYAADEGRWYVWDGNRWAMDQLDRVMDLTKDVIDDIRLQAMTTEGDDQANWIRHAHSSESLQRRKAIVDGARSQPELVLTADQFDTNPWLLVVKNGTIDLRSGRLRESNPEDLCSHSAGVAYDPDADCPRWQQHIHFITCGNRELATYLMCMAGYGLTGLTSERSFWFLEGAGRNGKNVFVEPILGVMGSYATTAASSLLTGGDEQHPTILADLRGRRFVFVDEVRQGRRLNAERIKALTGSKRIKARRMREDFFEFDAQFKLWIAGNGQPTVKDTSDGAWDRMKRVPFEARVADGQLIRDYAETLLEDEGPGILNWLIKGAVYWAGRHQAGETMAVPAKITAAVNEHRHEEDLVGLFLDEHPVVKTGREGDLMVPPQVHDRFYDWAVNEEKVPRGEPLLGKTKFLKEFTRRLGIETGGRVRVGGGSTEYPVRAVYEGWQWESATDREAAGNWVLATWEVPSNSIFAGGEEGQ